MGMKIDFDTKPRQQFLPNCRRPATEATIIDAEIKKLSSKRVIEPTGHCPNEIISDVFVRAKKDGTHRMTLTLRTSTNMQTKSSLRWTLYTPS